MKAPAPRHERQNRQSMFCVLFLFGVLVSALSLGSIRLYGLYLEQRLADCAMKTESVGNDYTLLEEYHASLLSPSRIYNYARSELSMVTASEVETIKLISDSYRGTALADAGNSSNADAGPGVLSRVFVGTANAKD